MLYMNNYIKNEYLDFANYHNSRLNIMIHILSGILYMSSLNILSNNILLLPYILLLLLTLNKVDVILFSLFLLYLSTTVLQSYKLNYKTHIILFINGCFIVPELSHLITNEMIVLNINNISIVKLITNIVYFLPFSIDRFSELSNIKKCIS